MRIIYTVFFTAHAVANALSNQINNELVISPEDAVAMHTETFERLADMYSIKKPASRTDMMIDTGNILASLFCDEVNSDCIENVKNATTEHFHSAEDEPRKISAYPGNLDSKLVVSLDKMTSAVHRIDDNTGYDMNDLINDLTYIKDEIEYMEGIKTEYKLAALSGMSMASESAALWQNIYSDPSHPLYGVHHPYYYVYDNDSSNEKIKGDINDNNRRLQNADTAAIILAVALAVLGAISEGNTDPFSLIIVVVSAALSGGVGGGDDDYDYDDGDYDYGGNIFEISQIACAFGVPVPLLC